MKESSVEKEVEVVEEVRKEEVVRSCSSSSVVSVVEQARSPLPLVMELQRKR